MFRLLPDPCVKLVVKAKAVSPLGLLRVAVQFPLMLSWCDPPPHPASVTNNESRSAITDSFIGSPGSSNVTEKEPETRRRVAPQRRKAARSTGFAGWSGSLTLRTTEMLAAFTMFRNAANVSRRTPDRYLMKYPDTLHFPSLSIIGVMVSTMTAEE